MRLEAKSLDGEVRDRVLKGVKDSEVMVTSNPNCDLSARRVLNWETSSWEAIYRGYDCELHLLGDILGT